MALSELRVFMARKKRKYWIDIPKARKFLYNAYGFKSKEQNWYELWIVHPEYKAVFHWYHTQGTLVMRFKDKFGEQENINLGEFGDEEDVALRILQKVKERPALIWDSSVKKQWEQGLDTIHKRLSESLQ